MLGLLLVYFLFYMQYVIIFVDRMYSYNVYELTRQNGESNQLNIDVVYKKCHCCFNMLHKQNYSQIRDVDTTLKEIAQYYIITIVF